MSEEAKPQAAETDEYILDSEEVTENDVTTTEEAQPEPETKPETNEAATTGENRDEKIKFDEKQQEWINSTLARQKREQREIEKRAEEAERRAKELEAKLPQSKRPELPPEPDPYSDTYKEDLGAYAEAFAAQQAWDARERAESEENLRKEREDAEQKYTTYTQTVGDYTDRAEKLGLSKEQLAQAGKAVADYDLPDRVAWFILRDPQGPLITKYLAQDNVALQKLADLAREDADFAIAEIAATIRPKAAGSRPKPNLPPDPHETLFGQGAREKQPGPPGATFE